MKIQILLLLIIFELLTACKTVKKEIDLTQVKITIDAQNRKWIEAAANYDTETLVSLYTEDATLLPPNRPMVKGKAMIRSYYERMKVRGVRLINTTLKTLDLSGQDSSVYEIGIYTMDVERRDSPTISDTGKYNTIWRLQSDGIWRMYADCWNSNAPLRLMQSNK